MHVVSVCQPTVPVLAAVSLMAAAGEPDIAGKLKAGLMVEGKQYRVHLDGYNFLPRFTGPDDPAVDVAEVAIQAEPVLRLVRRAAEEMKARIYTGLSRIVNELRRREGNDSAIIGRLKQALDNTEVDRFFDSVDIASGFQFDQEIELSKRKLPKITI